MGILAFQQANWCFTWCWQVNIVFEKMEKTGRDENVSKMDVDGRRQRRQSTRTSTSWKPQSGRRRPVEKLSLVDVDHENLSFLLVDVDHWGFHGRRQADVFITPKKQKKKWKKWTIVEKVKRGSTSIRCYSQTLVDTQKLVDSWGKY